MSVHPPRFVEDLSQRGELSSITGFGTGAVRFNEPDCFWTVAGSGVGATESFGLTGRTWGIDALGPPIRGRTKATDHGVDPVTVALGVIETLEREHCEPFAQHGAVRLVGEGSAVTTRRQRGDLGEALEHQDVVEGVDSTGDHHVRFTKIELVEPDLESGQGACTSRVDDAVRPTEIEPVGDSPGDDVAEKSGEGVFLPRRVAGRNVLAEDLKFAFGKTGSAEPSLPDRLLEAAGHVSGHFGAAGRAQNYADALTINLRNVATGGVLQYLLRDPQPEQLGCVSRGQDVRRNSEIHRREVDSGQESATVGVNLVRRARRRVVIVVEVPVRRGNVGEQVGALDDVAPEALGFGRPRKQSTRAHNCNGRMLGYHRSPGSP